MFAFLKICGSGKREGRELFKNLFLIKISKKLLVPFSKNQKIITAHHATQKFDYSKMR